MTQEYKGVCWMDLNIPKAKIEGPGTTLKEKIDLRLQTHLENGIRSIRVSMNPSLWFNGGLYITPLQYQQQLDDIVALCEAYHIQVYFCFHYGSSGANQLQKNLLTYPNFKQADWGLGWYDFVAMLAERYVGYSNFVGLQIWAEPATAYYRDLSLLEVEWAKFNQENVNCVNAANPAAHIFVMSPNYYAKKWVSDYYLENPLTGGNVIYGFQDYYMHHSDIVEAYNRGEPDIGRQLIDDWLRQAAYKMNAPVMLCETGFSVSRPAGQDWETQKLAIADFYDVLRSHNIGFSQWVWWLGNQDLQLLQDDWNTLSPQGVLLVKEMGVAAPEPPPPTRTIIAAALPVPLLLGKLHTLRTALISENIHRKLHPLI